MEKHRILKIAIVGAESTGKTWLCEELAKHFNTKWVPEYAREYFNNSDIYNYSLSDLENIANRQLEMENEYALKANKLLFCDTTLITLKIWAQLEFHKVPEAISHLHSESHYGLYLICNNDVAWERDEQRQNKFSRELILEMNKKEVELSGTPYFVVSGIDKQRLKNAINEVNRLFVKD